MSIEEWYMKRMVKGMSKEEKQNMMNKMMDEFFASMPPEEKKELMKQMMPRMMEKMMEGMTAEGKQELMSSMMPVMMSQMFGGEGGMSSMMMQMMRSSTKKDDEKGEAGERQRVPVMETQEDFKPWNFCPCRKPCEKSFKTKANSP